MFRTKITLAALALAATVGAAAPVAQADPARHMHNYFNGQPSSARHDLWYRYALSLTQAQQYVPFITDTLAPGGKASAGGRDPWYGYAVSLTQAQQSPRFITDTLAPGGTTPVEGYRFITDTLAPGGGSSVVSAPAPSGFDWGDFGIGAGAMAGIGALLLGSVRLLTRRNVVAV